MQQAFRGAGEGRRKALPARLVVVSSSQADSFEFRKVTTAVRIATKDVITVATPGCAAGAGLLVIRLMCFILRIPFRLLGQFDSRPDPPRWLSGVRRFHIQGYHRTHPYVTLPESCIQTQETLEAAQRVRGRLVFGENARPDVAVLLIGFQDRLKTRSKFRCRTRGI
mgnify:CR=1 FL=1